MAYCTPCRRHFSDNTALAQHQNNASAHKHSCDDCDKEFTTREALISHYVNSPRHHYCQRCNVHCKKRANLVRHYVGSHHYCEEHRSFFKSDEGLRQHYINNDDHDYCQVCSILFDDLEDFLEHGEAHHYVCEGCDTICETKKSLVTHKDTVHYYCKKCDRMFANQSNLDHHLGSALHKPRTIKCIGRGCASKFISLSGLIHHAESGACPARITRKLVNEFAIRVDHQHVITNPGRLVTDDSGTVSAPVENNYMATSRSWNGTAYECFLCNKTFRTLDALNMHLQSPRHSAKIYRCPMKGCETEYCALSALIQHVEWGSCGVRRNRQVKNVMDSLTSNMRGIA